MHVFEESIGKTFNGLTVLSCEMRKPIGASRWICRCVCGKEKNVSAHNVYYGNVMSCGCFTKNPKKHGLCGTYLYNVLKGMIQRCENPNHRNYKYYGGKGIRVCERWRTNPQNFIDDMGVRPAGMSIDRIDSSGDYEPGNCRWANTFTQAREKRRLIKIGDLSLPLLSWMKLRGINRTTFYKRINTLGMSIEEAINTPYRKAKKKKT